MAIFFGSVGLDQFFVNRHYITTAAREGVFGSQATERTDTTLVCVRLATGMDSVKVRPNRK